MAVADTHAVILHAAGGKRLGARASALFAACERREATLFVPVAALWETCALARVMRINLRRSPRAFFDDLFSNPAYQPVSLTPAQVFDADGLTFARDPFDGLICAAARDLGLPLVTRDAAIAASGAVKVIW
jgi:PIN domain nuclease of toxin-antitoxin system